MDNRLNAIWKVINSAHISEFKMDSYGTITLERNDVKFEVDEGSSLMDAPWVITLTNSKCHLFTISMWPSWPWSLENKIIRKLKEIFDYKSAERDKLNDLRFRESIDSLLKG